MRKLIIFLIIAMLVGCSNSKWASILNRYDVNEFFMGNPDGLHPDYVICQICKKLNNIENCPEKIELIKCYHCADVFKKAEGKKLYKKKQDEILITADPGLKNF